MRVDILTVGDELLIGQVVNTNATWLGEQLTTSGARIGRVVTMADDAQAIQAELDRSLNAADVVIVSGGIGPTHDDVTRQALADYFEAELCFDASVFQRIEERYAARGQTPPESNRRLAQVPEGFEVLPNPIGTAPGLLHTVPVQDRSVLVVALPGVPSELKAIVQDYVVPRLKDKVTVAPSAQRTLLTAGIQESDLQDAIEASAFLSHDHFSLAYLPSSKGVRLRITARGGTRQEARTRLDQFEEHIRSRVGAHVYGTGSESLEAIVGALLRAEGLTLAVAESCTGGLLTDRLTNVSGASDYLRGGIVAYCNGVKQDLLAVPEAMLQEHGAVSGPVARQMAVGVRERLDTDIGVSTTGIAGPKGATPEKPVGTVWIGIATRDTVAAHHFVFTSDRLFNKDRTCTEALNILRSAHTAAAELPVSPSLAAPTDAPE